MLQLTIRRVSKPDRELLNSLATLHKEAFPGFFLTSMGEKFLRYLYNGFIAQQDGICLIAEDNGRVVGFATGTTDPENFFKNLLRKHGIRFAFAAIPGLLKNPIFVVRKCFGALFYRGETPDNLPDAALLSSLAVSPNAGGKGIGQSLVHTFCDEVRKQKCKAIYLTTDESDNEDVNRFYAKCGFELRDSFQRPEKRIMNRWILKL